MTRIAALLSLIAVVATATYSAEFATRADLARILRTERFKLIRHVRQISASDWTAAGVHPQGRSITASMVDPGYSYQDMDFGTGDMPQRQLFMAATNPRHELIAYWQATQGGPVLRVLMLERGNAKPRLIFYAIMNNDIDHERWTWGELKGHILQNRMDHLLSAEQPGTFENRLP